MLQWNSAGALGNARPAFFLKFRTDIPVQNRVYTGVCDSHAPARICEFLEDLGAALGELKFILRSGGSGRGELALERGATRVLGHSEVYLPWGGFNRHASSLHHIPEDAFRLCADVEPKWQYLGRGSRKLMARACMEMLGKKLSRPSLFLICWTPFGAGEGDCRSAILLARMKGIPILDLGKFDTLPLDDLAFHTADFLAQFGIESIRKPLARQMHLAM
ncbi:MAG TPA: hypothetical protein VLR94_08950 [Acidobacteriota bacterium]|nr:hypothetical protein [Acidobacteriota bacterium]